MGFWIDLRILVENTTFIGKYFFQEFILLINEFLYRKRLYFFSEGK